MMQIIQTNKFAKIYKKLHKNQLEDVNLAIETIAENPGIGERKNGDLDWLRVYKFMCLNQLMLLGYCVSESDEIALTLIDVGSHENFYRDLKRRKI